RRGLRGRLVRAGPVGIARTRGPRKKLDRLLFGFALAAVVGDRRIADCGEHLGRTDRRNVRVWLRARPGDRVVRMDGRADFGDRREMVPPDLPEESDLYYAAISRTAFRQAHPDADGGVLAGAIHLRQPDFDHLARVDRGQPRRRYRPDSRTDRA